MGDFKFQAGKKYIMPVFFGPNDFWYDDNNKLYQPATVESVGIAFEVNPAQINAILPEPFESVAPILNVQSNDMKYIGWCGGGNYKMIKITTPVHFKGKKDDVIGDLILALFEDDPSQSLCGREMAGYNKPGAAIPRFTNFEGIYTSYAFDFETYFPFMKLRIDTNTKPENLQNLKDITSRIEGFISYAYYPDVFDRTKARDQFVSMMPKKWEKPVDYPYELLERKDEWCSGKIEFYEPEGKMDMPQWLPIGRWLADLEITGYLAANHSIWSEPCDYDRSIELK